MDNRLNHIEGISQLMDNLPYIEISFFQNDRSVNYWFY